MPRKTTTQQPAITRDGFVYRRGRELTALVLVCFGFYAFLDMVRIGSGVIAMLSVGIGDGWQRDEELRDLSRYTNAYISLAQFSIGLTLIILYCKWVHRSAVNARALGASGFRISPGWAVGWYFIPIAGLWMPFRAISEISRASRPGLPLDDSTAWWDSRASVLLPLWWGSWIIGQNLSALGRMLWLDRVGLGLDAVGACMMPVGYGIRTIAALLCCAVILQITRDQAHRAARILDAEHLDTHPRD